MVRRRSGAVSNHETPMRPSFETALTRLLRMRKKNYGCTPS
jgi:hypothetical protein